MLDSGEDRVDENAASPGQSVAKCADESKQCNGGWLGRDEDILARREIVLLEDTKALIVPYGQYYGHEGGQEHGSLLST